MSLAPRRPRAALAGAILFVAMAALVAAGAFTWLDQYAVSHLMPWLRPRHRPSVTFASLTLPGVRGPLGRALLDVWTGACRTCGQAVRTRPPTPPNST